MIQCVDLLVLWAADSATVVSWAESCVVLEVKQLLVVILAIVLPTCLVVVLAQLWLDRCSILVEFLV